MKIKNILCVAAAFVMGACMFAGCVPKDGGGSTDDTGDTDNIGNSGITDGGDGGQNEEPVKEVASYLRTDKQVYCADEDVYITAGGGADSWVGIFRGKNKFAENNAVVSYSVNKDGMYSGKRKVIDVETKLTNGDYTAVLFGGEGVSDVKVSTDFTVVENAVFSDKDEYYTDEDIVVTCYGKSGGWVGLYKADESPLDTQSICWYYIQKDTHLVGQSYIMQRTAKYNKSGYNPFPAGDYKLVLFETDSQSSSVESKAIKIKEGKVGKAHAPLSGTFNADDTESGLAGGTVTLNFDEENCLSSEVVAYWAHDDGAYNDYLPLAPVKVSSNPLTYSLPDKMYAPDGATALHVYGKNKNGLSSDYLELPVNIENKFSNKLLYSFNVVSDIHLSTQFGGPHKGKTVYNDNFRKACTDITMNDPDSEMMVIVGDIANEGRSEEWALSESIINETGAPEPFYTLGNHDLFPVTESYNIRVQDYLKYSGQKDRGDDKVYYEKEIKGLHHLALGSQQQDPNGEVNAMFLKDQLDWLDSRLAAITEKDPASPVFVYNHQSVYDTIAGSLKGHNWNGINPNDKVKEILAKYPQVLFFNGHSHWVMDSYRNAYFTSDVMSNAFNTSSVAYLWSTTDKEEEVAGSQGYYVSVFKDRVVIMGRDFSTKKWIPSACYVIKNVG